MANKLYTLVSVHYYDESVEDTNVAFNCLSLRYAKDICDDDNNSHWIGDTFQSDMDTISKYAWEKEDVDYFAQENPEVTGHVFKITDYESEDDRGFATVNYVPRKAKIQSILDDDDLG
jgi:hypothetical protein